MDKQGTPENVDLIIATPGHSFTVAYVKSLLKTLQFLQQKGVTAALVSEYSSHVANARESTLNGGHHNNINETRPLNGNLNYKKILWIDSDISWEPEDVWSLYQSDKDIVSGCYILGYGDVAAYKHSLGEPFSIKDVFETTEPVKVSGCGFGFLMVKQGVFESLTRPWFQQTFTTLTDSDTGTEYNFPLMGEDISWCKRVTDLGYDIWLDPKVRVAHHKTMRLGWEGLENL